MLSGLVGQYLGGRQAGQVAGAQVVEAQYHGGGDRQAQDEAPGAFAPEATLGQVGRCRGGVGGGAGLARTRKQLVAQSFFHLAPGAGGGFAGVVVATICAAAAQVFLEVFQRRHPLQGVGAWGVVLGGEGAGKQVGQCA